MANAFISGRRYPSGGGAAIPAGHQSYTANGTFNAPYTGVYTVAITAPVAKGGNGANGIDGYKVSNSSALYPTGGGAGGSAYIALYPLIITVQLTQGQQVPVTVNTAVTSFGSYGSFSAGTAGSNGTSGSQGNFSATPGIGGAGGTVPTFNVSDVIMSNNPNLPSISLSGENGIVNYSSVGNHILATAIGGAPNNNFGNVGGMGGNGYYILIVYKDIQEAYNFDNLPVTGSSAKAGRIDITWGNQ